VSDVWAKSGLWLAGLTAIAAGANGCHTHVAARASAPVKPSEASPVVELASHDNVLYARRANGRLHRLDTATGETRVLAQEGFVATAPDGSVAVTHKQLEPRGSRVEVWELATLRLLRARVFENGAGSFSMVNGAVQLVESDPPRPVRPEVPMPIPSIVMIPMVDTTLWDPRADRLRKGWGFEGNSREGCRFAPVGFRVACADWRGLSWRDLDSPEWGGSIWLGPEWLPRKEPRTEDAPTYPRKPQPDPPWTMWESLAWTGDGDRIILAYARAGDPPECRVERWTLGDQARSGKGAERLATVHRRCNIKVLAVSRDGNRVVTSEYPSRLVLRRAPKYEAIELAPIDATLATFLSGDERFVTVHRDGMRLWNTKTFGLLARWP
jgi:hypothetical protein